jgi:Uma2 family endonuclease
VSASIAGSGYLDRVAESIVEVVSPNDRPGDMREKVDEWLRSGAGLVWLIDPGRRTISVQRPGEPAILLREGDTIDGAPVLPNFSVAVSAFFA